MGELKLGIMQPYFFPYIGYWQLINAVDQYVIYDDVNYIKGGWVSRNRILLNNAPAYFHVPIINSSPNKRINEIEVNNNVRLIDKKLRILESAYRKAPYFQQAFPIVEEILRCGEKNLAEYLIFQIKRIVGYLDIRTELKISSKIEKNNSLRGSDKVVDICKRLGATDYYNAIGGMTLYSSEFFRQHRIALYFLKSKDFRYLQFQEEFFPNLSIIDVMMFNTIESILKQLNEYELIDDMTPT